jgi:hypothetical protein
VIAFLLLAAATAGAGAPPPVPADRAPLLQATATVRIVQGERIKPGDLPKTAMVTETRVRGSDGVERNARLVEFP